MCVIGAICQPSSGGTASPDSLSSSSFSTVTSIIILAVAIPGGLCLMIGICCWACYYTARTRKQQSSIKLSQQQQQQMQMMALQPGTSTSMAKGMSMQPPPQPYYYMIPSPQQPGKPSLDASHPYFYPSQAYPYPPQGYVYVGEAGTTTGTGPYQALHHAPFTQIQVQVEGTSALAPVSLSVPVPASTPTAASPPASAPASAPNPTQS